MYVYSSQKPFSSYISIDKSLYNIAKYNVTLNKTNITAYVIYARGIIKYNNITGLFVTLAILNPEYEIHVQGVRQRFIDNGGRMVLPKNIR